MTKESLLLRASAKNLYALILIASIWVLFRGHNEPGGGFIGGLLAVSATVLLAIAENPAAAERRLPGRNALRLAAIGVALSLASGFPALLRGGAYLTHLWGKVPLGLFTWKVSTVMLFDLGVYLAVWGGIGGFALALLAMESDEIEEPSA